MILRIILSSAKCSTLSLDSLVSRILSVCFFFFSLFAKGLNGGTTVSGTLVAAHKARLPIFVTGGIGGVHRGVEESEFSVKYFFSLRNKALQV